MSKEIYRIEIPIETQDNYSKGLKDAKEQVDSFEGSVKKTTKEVKKFESTSRKANKDVSSLGDTSTKAAKGIDKTGHSASKSEGQVSRFQGAIRKTRDRLKEVTSRRWRMTVQAVNKASGVVTRIGSQARRLIGRSYRFTVRAVDRATRILGGVRRAILSIPTMITVGLSVIGLGKLSEATLGAAMNFEGYETAMQHWLDGNKKEADKLIKWMGEFADKTPFSSPDLFPALSRGVGLSGGDVSQAKRLLEIASNMSALTPNRSVSDAMEALGAAQMGEFQMLKGYNVKMTKEQFDQMGGWSDFIDMIDKEFEDGARKFSKTFAGQLSTLKGYTSTIFREAGIGAKTAMTPYLESITDWIDNNQDKWGEWKETVRDAGERAGEWVASKLKTGFDHIKENYLDNDEFKNLDMQGKVQFIIGDFNEKLTEWLQSDGFQAVASAGIKLGAGMISAIAKSMGEAIMEHPSTAMLLGGVLLGTTTSIPIVIPLTIALAGAGAKAVEWLMNESDKYSPDNKVKEWNDTMSGRNTPKGGYGGKDATISEAPKKSLWQKTKDTISSGFRKSQKAIRGYSSGGFIDQEHMAMVGEGDRPEVVIPLGAEKRSRGLALWREAGQHLGVTPFANGGMAGNVSTSNPALNVSASGIDGTAFGRTFSESIGEGINDNVISLEQWKNRNIDEPMNNVVQEAVGFGTGTVRSFSTGQNRTPTQTKEYLDKQVKSPFKVIEGGASGWGSGTITEYVTGMKSQEAQVKEASKYLAEQVEKTFREELGIASPSKVMYSHGMWTAMGIVKGLDSVDIKGFTEEQINSMMSAFDGMGSGSGNVQKWLMAAMMATGAPASWLAPLTTIAMKESGGRTGPGTINKWDSNWARGTPSMGLMQTIMPTFQAHKVKGMDNIMNPIHNAAAAINYIKSRYGTPFNTPGIRSMAGGGPYKGYARGGVIDKHHIAQVGEGNKREVVIPLEQYRNRALGLLSYAQNELGVNDSPVSVPTGYSSGGSGMTVIVQSGAVTPTIVIEGEGNSNSSELAEQIADEVTNILADKLESISPNVAG